MKMGVYGANFVGIRGVSGLDIVGENAHGWTRLAAVSRPWAVSRLEHKEMGKKF